MTDPAPLDDNTRRLLGEGVLAHFARQFPYTPPGFQVQILDITTALGTQRKAAKLIGVSDRTLRRWANGATPTPANLAKIEKAHRSKNVRDKVFAEHLQRNGFTPATTVERLLYDAIQAGHTSPAELGAIMAKFLVDHKVPPMMIAHVPPQFSPGMDVMNITLCTISEDDDRGDFPFNIGSYA